MVNLERTCVLLFYYFLCFKVNLTNTAWWIFTRLYFCGGESWPNYFGKKVNWWRILTYWFCWKGEQRWRLEVGRFKMPFDGWITYKRRKYYRPRPKHILLFEKHGLKLALAVWKTKTKIDRASQLFFFNDCLSQVEKKIVLNFKKNCYIFSFTFTIVMIFSPCYAGIRMFLTNKDHVCVMIF